jgi:hypothetical protein
MAWLAPMLLMGDAGMRQWADGHEKARSSSGLMQKRWTLI